MAKMNSTVPIETVAVNDRITATFNTEELTVARSGKVANIRVFGRTRILETENGEEIVRYETSNPRKVTCVMISRYEPLQPALFRVDHV